MQQSHLKILIKYREIANVKSTNFLGLVTYCTFSWKYIFKEPAVELALTYS
jgi:hypothetical protein